jgi:putative ABC transport system substrate-binding protein
VPIRRLTVALCLLAVPLAADAQPAATHRLGFLSPASPPTLATRVEALKAGLADLGYREGRDYTIEYRWAEGQDTRLPGMAADLVKLKVSLILIHGSANPETSGKRLELLKEVVPGLARVALLWNSRNPVSTPEVKETLDAARALGLQVQSISVSDPGEYRNAFTAMTRERAQGLVILSDATFYGRRRELALLAQSHSLPAIAWAGELATEGILLGYGPDGVAQARRSAHYVDKILKGAKPGEIPMEQPVKFELRVNLKTARALQIPIPQSVLVRADEVIQ